MHIRAIFENFASFIFCPNHKSIHRSFDVRLIIFVFSRLTNDFGTKNASFWKMEEVDIYSQQIVAVLENPQKSTKIREITLPLVQLHSL